MSQLFNPDRFLRVCHQEWHISLRPFLRLLGTTLGVILAIALFKIFSSSDIWRNFYQQFGGTDPLGTMMDGMFWCGLAIYWCVAGANVFKPLSDKSSAISSLMLPASQFEKFAVRWLMMVPLALIMYVAGYVVLDLIRCLALLYYIPDFYIGYAFSIITMFDDKEAWLALFALTALQSFFVLGSALWPKRAAVSTFASLFAMALVLSWISGFIINMRLQDGHFFVGFNSPQEPSFLLILLVCGVICLINYALAYFRYREAEIINHW